ncbi:MAG: hypothetical protein WC994_10275 [Brumimicrobium sp.]
MNNRFSVLIRRYLLSVFIAVAGVVMIILGFSSNQDMLFMVAAVNLFIGGILALLFSAGILGRNLVLILGSISLVVAIILLNASFKSIDNTIQHDADYARSEKLVQYSLTQIRDIQREYRTQKGVYAKDFDELKDFFENDKIVKIDAAGTVPPRKLTIKERDFLYTDKRALDHNMTEREAALLVQGGNPSNALDLANFKRDTVEVYFKDEFLSSKTRQNLRESLGLGKFDIEELRYIPMTDPKEEWTIETRDNVIYLQGDTIATIHVYGKAPIPRFENGERSIVGFGNLNTNSDKATWE